MKTLDSRSEDDLSLVAGESVCLVRVVLGVLEESLRMAKRLLECFRVVAPRSEANMIEKERATAAMGRNVVNDAVRGSRKCVDGNGVTLLEPQVDCRFELPPCGVELGKRNVCINVLHDL